ncbi:MAG: hypothetical protein AAB339_09060, partial [Elusimicrobiota bacterium]
ILSIASIFVLQSFAQRASRSRVEPDVTDEEELPSTDAEAETPPGPVVISLEENINEFGRFADGGSDSNWYIGFNNAWIVKLPPAPEGEYSRAFIGARIGRAKAQPVSDRPWERVVIPGKVYMAISQRPAFSSEQSFFLAETSDIPIEPDSSVHMPGTGRSQWFWIEVPVGHVSFSKPNYLVIWSPSREFRDAAHSPILAGMEASKGEESEEPVAWNNHSIQGVPPRGEQGSLQVPISNIKPALALKLTSSEGRKVAVDEFSLRPSPAGLLARFSVEGRNIELAWIEMSQDELEWQRISGYLRTPPFVFTIPRTLIPQRGAYLRAKASDDMAVEGSSRIIFMPGGPRD